MELLLSIGAAWVIASVVLGVTLGRAIRRADRTELTPPPSTDSGKPTQDARPDDPQAEDRAA